MSRQITITRKKSVENFRNYIGILGKEEDVEEVYRVSQGKNLSYKTEAYEDNHITFIRVRSVEYIGEKMTWDLTVPETHNFIANNIVTHNTETLVVSMLFNLYLKPGCSGDDGFKIVVITPYQAQIDLIFNRMIQLIRSSPDTNESIRRNVKAPIYTIELQNNSTVKGFTAGTKSGGNADSVRGQPANMLVFDEADYLALKDMDSALSVITNFPNATVWMSSTPSGKREKFYDTCHEKDFKEFHFQSNVNPLFNEKLDALFKRQLTELGYQHEVLAEFGEQEQGVFQNSYVQHAKQNYRYGDMPFHRSWTYTIGVDWNDTKNGTTISVLGFDPMAGKFWIVDRHVVSRDGWTQLAACQKIADLNRIWHPIAIYVDAGYGATQLEILHKFGWDALVSKEKGSAHADSKLRSIVKAYNFSSKVQVRDLFTRELIDKHAKPFLVEQSVRRFEAGDIYFPETDESLEAQLLGYIIERITPTGNPVYKAGNETVGDHALDALMLSIVAFALEVTPLGNPKFSSRIAFSGRIGERMEPPIHEGDTVVKGNRKEKEQKIRDSSRPEPGRSEMMEHQSLFPRESLPANHTNTESHVRPWRHEGFNRDAPAPRVRTLQQAGREAQQRLGLRPRRGGPPRRKNIR